MGCLFSCCRYEPDDNKIDTTPVLTEQEKEDVANKRLQYIENKYQPQKPINKFKSNDIPYKEEKKHEQYIRDWRD